MKSPTKIRPAPSGAIKILRSPTAMDRDRITPADVSDIPENCVVLPPMVVFDKPEPIRKKK